MSSPESDLLYNPSVMEYILTYIHFIFSIFWLKPKLSVGLYHQVQYIFVGCLIFAVVIDCHLTVMVIHCKLLENSMLPQHRYFAMLLESVHHHIMQGWSSSYPRCYYFQDCLPSLKNWSCRRSLEVYFKPDGDH